MNILIQEHCSAIDKVISSKHQIQVKIEIRVVLDVFERSSKHQIQVKIEIRVLKKILIALINQSSFVCLLLR